MASTTLPGSSNQDRTPFQGARVNLDGFDMNELMEQILFVGGVSSSLMLSNVHAILRERGLDICMETCFVSARDPSDPKGKSIGLHANCIRWKDKVYGVDGINTRNEIEQWLIEVLMGIFLRRGTHPEQVKIQWAPCEDDGALPATQPGVEAIREMVDTHLAHHEREYLDNIVSAAPAGSKKTGPRL